MDVKTEVVIALRRILRVAEVDSRRVARLTGLSTSQLLVLRFIEREPGATVGQIAEALTLRQATVTALLDRLEERGLVRRHRKASDRRMVEVHLADDGKRLLDGTPRLLQHRFVERLAALETWEQTWILAALQRVGAMLDADQLDASPILDSAEVGSDYSATPADVDDSPITEP